MAQGDFTKEEAQATVEAFKEVYDQLTKEKQIEFIGHANDIYLFLGGAMEAAPAEQE